MVIKCLYSYFVRQRLLVTNIIPSVKKELFYEKIKQDCGEVNIERENHNVQGCVHIFVDIILLLLVCLKFEFLL